MAGTFTGLPLADLITLRTSYLAAVANLAVSESYSIAGRSVTRANLPDIKATLAELNTEIRRQQGTALTSTYARISTG
jgi:hypothetical protein